MNVIQINNKTYKPATIEELNVKRGIIYAIRNQYDGKIYIGKTSKTFNLRYRLGKWWATTTNILLKRTLLLSSYAKFDIFILKDGLKKDKTLCKWEIYFANILQTYVPKGYNIRECGEGAVIHLKEVRDKIRIANIQRQKAYRVRHIKSDSIISIVNLKKWCKENNIKENAFRNLLCGLILTSQGYCKEETTLLKIKEKRGQRARRKEGYKIKNIKTGEIITIFNIKYFCEQHGLRYAAFKTMIHGYTLISCGYSLQETKIRQEKIFQITSPGGEIIKFTNISKFNKKYNFNLNGLIYRGVKKNREGWSNLKLFEGGRLIRDY